MDTTFETFTVVIFQVKVLWVVLPCSVMVGHQCFRGPCCLCPQGEVAGVGENDIDIGPDWRRTAGAASQ
jgi:hypothetical protein